MTYINAIIGFIKALPIIKDFVVGIQRWYKAVRRDRADNDFDEALDTAAKTKNTEDLQKELGDVL